MFLLDIQQNAFNRRFTVSKCVTNILSLGTVLNETRKSFVAASSQENGSITTFTSFLQLNETATETLNPESKTLFRRPKESF